MSRVTVPLSAALFAIVGMYAMADEISAESLRSREAAIRLLRAWRTQREERVTQLLAVLKDDNASVDAHIAALELLGELGAESAVPWLVKHIDKVEDTRVMIRPIHRDAQYPAVGTLVWIGKESSRRALEALREEDDPLRRRLLLNVVERVEGPVVTLLMLELEIYKAQEAKSGKVADRMEAALERLAPAWADERARHSYPAVHPDCLPREEDF